jgi:drug/metabolite transporter (DMT)-like permease
MEFEELQAIWDTQNERPAFSMDDSRLAVGLYQQREQSRRRLFREQFGPVYFGALFIAAVSVCVFLAFFAKTISGMAPTDPLMSVWDGAALAGAVGAAFYVVVSLFARRKRHERTQNVFAPSLREELERGISQIDFELSLYSTPRVVKMAVLLSVATTVFMWEAGRLNGDPTPWMMLVYALFCICPGTWYGFNAKKGIVERLMLRRRALESMRAALDEDVMLHP